MFRRKLKDLGKFREDVLLAWGKKSNFGSGDTGVEPVMAESLDDFVAAITSIVLDFKL